jgi:hypothetical protein
MSRNHGVLSTNWCQPTSSGTVQEVCEREDGANAGELRLDARAGVPLALAISRASIIAVCKEPTTRYG